MRIWDLPASQLCLKHLLAEHKELHAIWSILGKGKLGARANPETRRWVGARRALYQRHAQEVAGLLRLSAPHNSPLDAKLATGLARPRTKLDSLARQRQRLKQGGCLCRTSRRSGWFS